MKRRSLLGDLRWSLVILPLWSCPCPCSTQMSTCEFVGPDWVSMTLIWSQFESLSNVQEGGDDHSWRSPAGDDKGVPLPPGFINIMPPGGTRWTFFQHHTTRWNFFQYHVTRCNQVTLVIRKAIPQTFHPGSTCPENGLLQVAPISNTFFHL